MFDRFIAFAAKISPDATAMVSFDGEISFGRLDADIDRIAVALLKELNPLPKVVAVSYQQMHPHWLFLLALSRIGVASASVSDNAFVAAEEIEVIKPNLIISDELFDIEEGPRIVVFDSKWVRSVLSGPVVTPVRLIEDFNRLVRVAISSGTSAKKHRIDFLGRTIEKSLLRMVQQEHIHWAHESNISRDTRILPTLGLGSIHSFLTILSTWLVGGSVIVADREQYPAAIVMLHPTLMVASPIQLENIVNQLPSDLPVLHSFRLLVSTAFLSRSLHEVIVSRLTPHIRIIYATSEIGVISGAPVTQLLYEDMAGWLLPWVDLQIVNDQDEVLPFGETGRIRVKSSDQAGEYYGDKAATKAQFHDGWFYPGDLGILSSQGMLRIVGRTDELFNFGGDKFSAGSIDRIVRAVPGVKDAALFIMKNERGLPEPWMAIVRDENYSNDKVSEALEQNFHNLPHVTALWVNRIPRNAVDQVLRHQLAVTAATHFHKYRP